MECHIFLEEISKKLNFLDVNNPQELAILSGKFEELLEKDDDDENCHKIVHNSIDILEKMIFNDISLDEGFSDLVENVEELLNYSFEIENMSDKENVSVKDSIKEKKDSSELVVSQSIIGEFISDGLDALQEMESLIIAYDKKDSDNEEELDELKRKLHTLKGEAGVLNLTSIYDVIHQFEDYLSEYQDIRVMFAVIDWIKKQLNLISTKGADFLESNSELLAFISENSNDSYKLESQKEPNHLKNAIIKEYDLDDKKYDLKNVDSDIFEDFISESLDHLENAESDVFVLKENFLNEESINTIFRSFHTIKGLAGFVGLPSIQSFTHKAENLLDKIRTDEIKLNDEILDIIFEVVSALREEIDKLAKAWTDNSECLISENFKVLVKQISAIIKGDCIGEKLVENNVITPQQLYEATKCQRDNQQDMQLGAIISEKFDVSKEKINKVLGPDKKDYDELEEKKNQKKKKNIIEDKIKVSTKRLDELMNLIGELVISQTMLQNEIRKSDFESKKIDANLNQMDKISKNLQSKSLSLRLLPVKGVFQKMNRLVYDLAKKTGKSIEVSIVGEETEVDKNIIEQISDPLIHMIRNSVDHGIEGADERIKIGKSEHGHVTLKAYQESGNICIEIEDDGRGLDKEKILEKAIEKKIIKEDHNLSDDEIFKLIFEPGFSTAAEVTDISGRGVGMDVVKKNIEKLRGNIVVKSEPNKGSKFIIYLPLTMAIMDGMIIRVGKEMYIVPILNIVETFRPEKGNIVSIKGKDEMIKLHDELIHFIKLSDILDIESAIVNPLESIVMIVELMGKKMGIMIDEIIEQQQIVIKSLGETFKNLDLFLGGTILPNGEIGLILDIQSLINEKRSSEVFNERG